MKKGQKLANETRAIKRSTEEHQAAIKVQSAIRMEQSRSRVCRFS